MKISCRKKIIFVIITTLLSAAIIEIGLRLFGFQAHNDASITQYFWVSDPILGFSNVKNGSFIYKKIHNEPLITTDKEGYRTTTPSYSDSSAKVVFLGDSTTFCAEVNDEQTFASLVATELAPLKTTVINGSVRGFNTVQSWLMLQTYFSQTR